MNFFFHGDGEKRQKDTTIFTRTQVFVGELYLEFSKCKEEDYSFCSNIPGQNVPQIPRPVPNPTTKHYKTYEDTGLGKYHYLWDGGRTTRKSLYLSRMNLFKQTILCVPLFSLRIPKKSKFKNFRPP